MDNTQENIILSDCSSLLSPSSTSTSTSSPVQKVLNLSGPVFEAKHKTNKYSHRLMKSHSEFESKLDFVLDNKSNFSESGELRHSCAENTCCHIAFQTERERNKFIKLTKTRLDGKFQIKKRHRSIQKSNNSSKNSCKELYRNIGKYDMFIRQANDSKNDTLPRDDIISQITYKTDEDFESSINAELEKKLLQVIATQNYNSNSSKIESKSSISKSMESIKDCDLNKVKRSSCHISIQTDPEKMKTETNIHHEFTEMKCYFLLFFLIHILCIIYPDFFRLSFWFLYCCNILSWTRVQNSS